MAVRACAELQGNTFLVITQQPPSPARMSHFTAEVKGQLEVLQSQGRIPPPRQQEVLCVPIIVR